MPSSSRKTKSSRSSRSSRNNSATLWRRVPVNRSIVLALFVLASTVGLYFGVGFSHAAQTELQSGIGGNGGGGPQCADSNGGIYACNGSAGENWGGIDSSGRLHINGLCYAQVGANSTKGVGSSAQGLAVAGVSCPGTTVPWGGTWYWDNSHRLHNKHAESAAGTTQYCLDVKGAALSNPLETYICNGGSNQTWFVGTYGSSSGGGGGGGSGGSAAGIAIRNVAIQFAGKEKETPDTCNCGGVKILGANIDTFTQNNPEFWCADFASWVFWKAGYGLTNTAAYHKTAAVDSINAWFAARKAWTDNNATTRNNNPPQTGDWVGFTNSQGTHGGIVDSYDRSTGDLWVIEGNASNMVKRVHYTKASGFNDGSQGSDATGWGHMFN